MKLFLFALALTLTQVALAKPLLTCASHNSVFVQLETVKDGTITGSMNHNYNGANLACKFGAKESFEMYGEMKCVGLWNIAFDDNGEGTDKAVIITIKKNRSGKVQAIFANNWDGRSPENGEIEVLDCK